MGYGPDDRGIWVRFLTERDFCVVLSVHTGFGADPATYPMGSRSSFPGVKAAGA
jgi:hypothetical protein